MKLFFVLMILFLAAVQGWAQPLKSLGLIGNRVQERFETLVQEDLSLLEKEGFYEAAKFFRNFPRELTYWTQDYVGDYRVKVELFALQYRDIGNLAPPEVAESLENFLESLRLGEEPLPQIIIRERGEKIFYLYVLPLKVKKSCLPCHGSRIRFQEELRELYPEDQARELKVGDLRGALVIEIAPEALNRFASKLSKSP
ncbi:MAG: DUF3365 domain-containing protein [Thermodesulfobacteria bacterium]|nr:DUF3365 domain-containing protein [Thermodesulfobacteriota bacterium]